MMCYKHHYEKEREKEKGNIFIQKIKDLDGYDLILIIVGILFVLILSSSAISIFRTNKKTVDIKVPNQILSKEQLNKNPEVSMNETSKLNEKNFEVFISKKVPNKGIILLKYTDFIKNNNKIILYKATKKIKISGNPEILKKLNVSISTNTTNNKMNFNTESINIELDHNQKNNSILSVELNVALLDKEQILEDNVIITVAYEESYVE